MTKILKLKWKQAVLIIALCVLASASFFVFKGVFQTAEAEDGEQTVRIYAPTGQKSTAYFREGYWKINGYVVAGSSYRSYARFELDNIPAEANILNVEFYGYPRYCRPEHNTDIYSIEYDPIPTAERLLWPDIKDGNQYAADSLILDANAGCVNTDYQSIDLGEQAAKDLQNSLDKGWFAIGFSSDDNYAYFYGQVFSDKAPYIEVTYTTNQAPVFDSINIEPVLQTVGSATDFIIDYSDGEGDMSKLYVCREDSLINQICGGGAWCDSGEFSSSTPATCSYVNQTENIGQNDYYVFLCDERGLCSESSFGSFFVSEEQSGTSTPSIGSDEIFVSEGKVGIGTNNPSEKLEVKGNIKVEGNILSDGDICIGKCE